MAVDTLMVEDTELGIAAHLNRASLHRGRIALAAGWTLVGLGALVVYGWSARISWLVQLAPTWSSMKLNTALCFAALGLGMIALAYGARRFAGAAALFVVAVGAATGVEYLFSVDLSLDYILIEPFYVEPGVPAGRMSPITAGLFVCAGVALALTSLRPSSLRASSAGVIASVIGGVALAAIIGYATRTPIAYGWGAAASVAMHTAFGFLVAATGLGAHAAGQEQEYLPQWLPWAALIAGFACTLALGLALMGELTPSSRSLIPETTMAVGAAFSMLMAVALQSRRRLAEKSDLVRSALARREEALREKELLLKEVHHRVKNNLQVVASMLGLQAGKARDPDARGMLMNCRQRVMSMALVHERLYGAGDLRRIDLGGLVRDIAAMLLGASPQAVLDAKFEIEPIVVDIETAFPASLVVNELIANSLKHAFVGRARGVVEISVLLESEQRVRISVADDGVGGVTLAMFEGGATLGATIVRSLVRQLDGELTVGPGPGARISFSFPLSRR